MGCNCNNPQKRYKNVCGANTPPVIEVHSEECPVLFHTVIIPASVGNITTIPPTPGAYRNARVTYEADGLSYLYDSDGIPQLLSMPGEGGGAVESVNGQTGVVVLDANDVGAAKNTVFYANVSESGNNRHIYKNPDMTGEVSVQELLDANEAGPVVLRMSTSATPEYFNDAYLQNTYVGNSDYQFLFLDNRVYYEYDGTATTDTVYYFSRSSIQLEMSAGSNISISGNTISGAYTHFTGTDGVADGVQGLVPAPTTTDAGKFLKADGTWDNAGGGTLYTTYGQNEDGAMTQKATTDLVYTGGNPKKINIGDNGVTGGTNSIIIGSEDSGTISSSATDAVIIGHDITDSSSNTIAIGHGSAAQDTNAISIGHDSKAQSQAAIAIGNNAEAADQDSISIGYSTTANGQYSTAIGNGSSANGAHAQALGVDASAAGNYTICLGEHAITTSANGTGAIALGAGTQPRAAGVIDVEDHWFLAMGYNGTVYRLLSGLHDGVELHDAATVAQGNTLATSAPTTSTAGVLGQLYTDTTNMHTYQCTAIDTTDPNNPSFTWTQRW